MDDHSTGINLNLKNSALLFAIVFVVTFIFNNAVINSLPILFIAYLIISTFAIIKNYYNLFTLINIIALQFNAEFNYYNKFTAISIFGLFLLILIIKNKSYSEKENYIPILIVIYAILVSIGKGPIKDNLNGLGIIYFIFVFMAYIKLNFSKTFLISLAFLPLILYPISIYQLIYRPEHGFSLGRLEGTVFQQNGFAILTNQFIILSLSIYLFTKIRVFLVLAILYMFLTIMTQSRTGIVALVFGIFVIILLAKNHFNITLNGFLKILGFSLIIFLFTQTSFFKQSRYENITIKDLQTDRAYIWEDMRDNFKGNVFFGLGLGGVERLKKNIIYNIDLHSTYITIIASIGIIGLLLILFFLFYNLIKIFLFYRNNFEDLDTEEKIIGLSAIGCIMSLFVSAFTGSWSFSTYTSLLAFIFLAQAISIVSNKLKNQVYPV